MSHLVVVDHPLVQHKLTLMRQRETPTSEFRRLVREVSLLLAYEITRDLPLETRHIETPLMPMEAKVLAGKKVCLISILRAGNGLLDGMLDLIPSARVGHVGLYRDPTTLKPVEYYYKVPQDIAERPVIIVDPMLATANSAVGKPCAAAMGTRSTRAPASFKTSPTASSLPGPASSNKQPNRDRIRRPLLRSA